MRRPTSLHILSQNHLKTGLSSRATDGDGHGSYGLSLLVKPMTNGRWSKTWSQYARIGGNYTSIGLGSYPAVSLAEARAGGPWVRVTAAMTRHPRQPRPYPACGCP